tara:strand:+ start:511 stop:759 length:249 start_codon:yes stop_codon:yes gene_type:complete
MSKLLNAFIQKEYIPLKQFKLEVIKIIFDKPDSDLTDAKIYAKLRQLTFDATQANLLDVSEDASDEEKKISKSTHWALMNIS